MKPKILITAILVAGTLLLGYLAFGKNHSNPTAGTSGTFAANNPTAVKQDLPQPAKLDEVSQNTKELLNIVDQQDPAVALKELSRRMDTNPAVFKNCHGIAHEIGHESYKKYKNFVAALKFQDSVCSDGYLHGIIEQRFFYAPNVSNILQDMKTICNGTGVAAGRCYHGIGHGIMYYTANDLPKSLGICDSLAGSAIGRCNEGVFMENFLSDQIIHPSTVDKNNPFYPCPIEAGRFKPYCYFYAPIFFLSLHNNDYAAALKWCATAESAGVVACVRGVGSLAMKYNIRDPKFAENACNQAIKSSQISSCIDGVVSYYLTFYDHLSKARTMCSQMEPKNQAACNTAIKRRVGSFTD